jgi:Protein of unknown function (DUF3800)
MYLLYLDDSGSVDNPKENYLVLGGVCVHESQVHYFTDGMDRIAERIQPGDPDGVEFHASVIFSGREEPWKGMTKREDRQSVIKDVLTILVDAPESTRTFATVVQKSSTDQNPMHLAFIEMCSKFDRFLSLPNVDSFGLIILDESTHATQLEMLSRRFRKLGEDRGIKKIVDAPVFVSSRSFRCVQIADHVAYSVFRRFEARDANYFDVFASRFESLDGLDHGLRHFERGAAENCTCPGCLSRRINSRDTHVK